MYGSYGSSSSSYSSSYNSYTSYSSMSSPMDIAPTPFSSRGPDASCAFPSWPRRSSLSESDASEERATSYLSDEDLFPTDVFEDDARSVSSNGSSSPTQSPTQMTEVDLIEMQRERALYQREMMRVLMSEKERRRQQVKKQKRSTGGSSSTSAKKNSKSKLSAMTPIAEAE
ncbi:hypothetical protein B0H67DRAFT_379037 [Lasiosphaeris hirsuta]|uniref:Uncharacterized protein n=1 Tax=Lasiosphaeris hirsuta TaxID=260670 RepID=A0AA40DJC4_9PEZI|nr:hypothetical protein B0H67DRAFT_379037 [Lasiosphaeris hirsuta]